MTQTPAEEIEIMAGMDRLLREEHQRLTQKAPRCHFRAMYLDTGDISDYHTESWWECSVCGHTKPEDWVVAQNLHEDGA